MEQLQTTAERLVRAPPPPPPDLSPPLALEQALTQLTELISAHERGLVPRSNSGGAAAHAAGNAPVPLHGSSSGSSSGRVGVDAALDAALPPLARMVEASAESLSADSPSRLDDGASLDPTAHKVSVCCR